MRTRPTIILALLGVSTAFVFYPVRPASPQSTVMTVKKIPITTKQLPAENGRVPIELRCADAELSGNTIEKLSCVLKNKTNKNMAAASVSISVTVDRDGALSQDSGYLSFDSLLLADFREGNMSIFIPPGGEYVLEDLSTDYGNAVVKGIEAHLDYVEFENKIAIGPNHRGSRIIGETREGAEKYKEWLVKQYEKKGRSVEEILQLLENYQTLPEGVGIEGGNQKEGARSYRNYIRKTYLKKGAEELHKHLKRNTTR